MSFIQRLLPTTTQREASQRHRLITSGQQTATAQHPELQGISPAHTPVSARSPQVRESCKSSGKQGKTVKTTKSQYCLVIKIGRKRKKIYCLLARAEGAGEWAEAAGDESTVLPLPCRVGSICRAQSPGLGAGESISRGSPQCPAKPARRKLACPSPQQTSASTQIFLR